MHSSVTFPAGEAGAESDELELVRRAAVDASALAALYERYVVRVYRFLRVRCTGPDEAADLTQQVFLKMAEALPRYRERGVPFAAWLFRIARNAAIDRARRHRRTVPWDSLTQAAAPDDVEAWVLDRETRARVGALLAALSSDERELLSLRFAAGLSSREIAAVVGGSEAAVKKRLTRTIQRLKERSNG
jgi:RNA polymerase sigma-70 factor (ECF subfamily)